MWYTLNRCPLGHRPSASLPKGDRRARNINAAARGARVTSIHDPALLGSVPLSDHALSHVMSDLLSSEWAPTDEDEIEAALAETGYRPNEISQIMSAWRVHWLHRSCGTCGEEATHMWASLSEEGVPTSMNGAWTFTPSCDGCGGNQYDDCAGRPVIRAPIDTPTTIPHPHVPTARMHDVNKATLDGIEASLNEFDAETLDNQQGLDHQMSRPLVDRVADHIAYTISLQRKLVGVKEAVR